MLSALKNRYIGSKKFYRMVLAVAVPIMVQNFITNFVNMLDNIMVGQIGTAPMSGVSIANQILFVVRLALFGAVSGAGIFTAQFAGSRDHEGIRNTFRFKLISCLAIVGISIGIFIGWGDKLISMFLKGEGSAEDAALYLKYGMQYLTIMLVELVPFAISNAYCSTLREQGETLVPMVSGICAVLVNLVFNYLLIFGHFGFPELGVQGAAIATVISRFVELGIVIVWTHTHKERMPFAEGLYKTFAVPAALTKRIIVKGMPLLANETLFSLGMTLVNQCYSLRGLEVMAAMNICNTLANVMRVGSMAMGNAVGIIMGQKLGAGEKREVLMDTDRKLMAFSVALNATFALLLVAGSPIFPKIYNTSDSVRTMATGFMRVMALLMPIQAYGNAAYFTLRSGGKTLITMLFDCCFVWVVLVPVANILSRFTNMNVTMLLLCTQMTDLIKCVIGGYLIHKGVWIHNIVNDGSK